MNWRWDQGRLGYFQLDEIHSIANALTVFEGKALPTGDDPDTLREVLSQFSDMPFLPVTYKVWRNYKRVFGCQMLATDVTGILVCTGLCKQVAAREIGGDDYLLHIARNFSYPSPVFNDYDIGSPQVFPICAIIKYLVSRLISSATPMVSLDDLIDHVKGNNCDGSEPMEAYLRLPSSGHRVAQTNDAYRQIRELVRFISQFTFLKWNNPNLVLDVSTQEEAIQIANLFDPVRRPRLHEPSSELLEIGRAGADRFPEARLGEGGFNAFDFEFAEGSRAQVLHLRIERSRQLKELYFARTPTPSQCDMCSRDTLDHYPWTQRLIEIHHLLPLSSPLRVEHESTSLRDVVGLCPSCHRATHRFYSSWLKDRGIADFQSYPDARAAYELAKNEYVH